MASPSMWSIMNDVRAHALGATCRVPGVLHLDAGWTDPVLGLLECVARMRWGLSDLSQCWGASGVRYEVMGADARPRVAGGRLSAAIRVLGGGRASAFERLQRHYGILVSQKACLSVDAALATIMESLRRGVPAIAAFAPLVEFQSVREAARTVAPQVIGIRGYDASKKCLELMAASGAVVAMSLEEYVLEFEEAARKGAAPGLVELTRASDWRAQPMERSTLTLEIGCLLDNLCSRAPGLGLRGLRRWAEDVAFAYDALPAPFVVPGVWEVARERYCWRRALRHWHRAVPDAAAELQGLGDRLDTAVQRWMRAASAIDRSVKHAQTELMGQVPGLLAAAVESESDLASLLPTFLDAIDSVHYDTP